ncbi:MAG TPA: EAL domain-containing protein [Acidimicrobiales bacterium]|nr:EAL domain-containing protein [Acidimicrobiales bacterium]
MVLALATAAVAAGITVARAVGLDALPGRHVPWPVIAFMYALTEVFLVHFEHRRESHAVSFSAVPLVIGLFTLSPVALICARVLGSGLTLAVRWRQAPLKVAVNLASFWLETAVAVFVFHWLVGGGAGAGVGPRMWAPAVFAAVAGDLVQALVVTAAISLSERRVEPLDGAALLGPAVSVANTGLALIAVVLWAAEPAAVGLLVLLLPLLYGSTRAHSQLREKHRSLEQLHHFTNAIGQSVVAGKLVPVALAEIRDLMHAEASWLCVGGTDGVVRVRAEGDSEESVVSVPMPAGALDDMLHRAALAAGQPILVSAAGTLAGEGDAARVVRSAGLGQVLVAPLAQVSGPPVTLVVADRSGGVRPFGAEDMQLFATLANQARASFENSHLLERLREQAAASEHQSLHDALTGLPNRVLFGSRLAASLERDLPLAVLLLDLDRFKEVNDTLGHHNGDVLLQEVGSRLRAEVRRGDTIARLGGDEFAILLHDVSGVDDAVAVAHTVLAALDAPFDLSGVPVTVAASIGVAMAPVHGVDVALLLQRADVAMYTAKADQSGVEPYRPERDNYSADRLALAGELRAAIEGGRLAVHYQPQIDLASGCVSGVEALVRWPGGPSGVSPAELVTLAEHTGLVRGLTRLVLSQAVAAAAAWHRQGWKLRMSVNLSARVLIDRDLASEVRAVLAAAGLPASFLCLELTETSIMGDDEHTLEVLSSLRAIGVTLAVDDFGMGYSSLAYLKRLPVGEIKIDKSFVMGMAEDDAEDEAIVRSVVDLGRNLGLAVVAEGVETDDAAARLRDMGCATGQGYLFSRPLAASDLSAWLSGARVASAVPVPVAAAVA